MKSLPLEVLVLSRWLCDSLLCSGESVDSVDLQREEAVDHSRRPLESLAAVMCAVILELNFVIQFRLAPKQSGESSVRATVTFDLT